MISFIVDLAADIYLRKMLLYANFKSSFQIQIFVVEY